MREWEDSQVNDRQEAHKNNQPDKAVASVWRERRARAKENRWRRRKKRRSRIIEIITTLIM